MSLNPTILQNYRSKYTNVADKNERRASRYGAWELFKQDTATAPIFDAETISHLKVGIDQGQEVPVLNARDVTVSNSYTRTCAMQSDESDSGLISLTFNTYGWGFSMKPIVNDKNLISYMNEFTEKMDSYLLKYAAQLDAACISQLVLAKNQKWDGIVPNFYAAQVADYLQIPNSDKDKLYNKMEAIMQKMDFYGKKNILAATEHIPTLNDIAAGNGFNTYNDTAGTATNQSATNANRNYSLQGFDWFFTNRLEPAVGKESVGFALDKGSTFTLNRNDVDARAGHNTGDKFWSEELLPLVGQKVGLFYQKDCADLSADVASGSRSLLESFEFSTDNTFATVYNSRQGALSTDDYDPIVGWEILNV